MPRSEFWPFGEKNQTEDSACGGESIQKQLGEIEGEVIEMKMELAAMKLKHQESDKPDDQEQDSDDIVKDSRPHNSYLRYHDVKYTSEHDEIFNLRADLFRAKNAAEEERFQRLKYEGKLKDLEVKLKEICSAGKASELNEMQKANEEEVICLKSHIRDLKEEIEELKMTVDEKTDRINEYRSKYLQSHQQVEELQRQIEAADIENKETNDHIQSELRKMKIQFQEKLMDLAPLPELLKSAQLQLQEAKQMQKLAEENTAMISDELRFVKEKLVQAVNNAAQEKHEKTKLIEEHSACKKELQENQQGMVVLVKDLGDQKCKVLRLEERLKQLEIIYNEKIVETSRLSRDFEEYKMESTRALNRAKEKLEITRHDLLGQMSEMETQTISCRAQCRMYQRERDALRQKMLLQVRSLRDNLELVASRMHGLQGQISLMKHCYSKVLPQDIGNLEDNDYEDFDGISNQ